METYTKDQVIQLVRDELERTNKALKLKTRLSGLTEKDWEYIGVIVCALKEPEKRNKVYSQGKYNVNEMFV